MSDKILTTITSEDDGQRLDRWCKKHHPEIPYTLLQKLLRKGAIRVDGKKTKADARISTGQEIAVPTVEVIASSKKPAPKATKEEAQKYLLDNILYQDDQIIAINKPPGLAAQGGSKVKRSVDVMLEHLPFLMSSPLERSEMRGSQEVSHKIPAQGGDDNYGEQPKLVHRIDKDTSGVMVLARNRKSAADLGKRFKSKEVEKLYWAICVGVPEPKQGKISLPLVAKQKQGTIEKAAVDEEEGKPATTQYEVLDVAAGKLSLVALQPITGRMHQLRVHMAHIGHPILGDGKYGGKAAFIHGLSNNMHLHARALTLPNYTKNQPLTLTAPLPKHMQATFDMFGFTGE